MIRAESATPNRQPRGARRRPMPASTVQTHGSCTCVHGLVLGSAWWFLHHLRVGQLDHPPRRPWPTIRQVEDEPATVRSARTATVPTAGLSTAGLSTAGLSTAGLSTTGLSTAGLSTAGSSAAGVCTAAIHAAAIYAATVHSAAAATGTASDCATELADGRSPHQSTEPFLSGTVGSAAQHSPPGHVRRLRRS